MKKFSVRDLFFVVTIAAILCGRRLERRQTRRLREELRNELNQQNTLTRLLTWT